MRPKTHRPALSNSEVLLRGAMRQIEITHGKWQAERPKSLLCRAFLKSAARTRSVVETHHLPPNEFQVTV